MYRTQKKSQEGLGKTEVRISERLFREGRGERDKVVEGILDERNG